MRRNELYPFIVGRKCLLRLIKRKCAKRRAHDVLHPGAGRRRRGGRKGRGEDEGPGRVAHQVAHDARAADGPAFAGNGLAESGHGGKDVADAALRTALA